MSEMKSLLCLIALGSVTPYTLTRFTLTRRTEPPMAPSVALEWHDPSSQSKTYCFLPADLNGPDELRIITVSELEFVDAGIGYQIWPGGVALSLCAMAGEAGDIQGKRVVEIGESYPLRSPP